MTEELRAKTWVKMTVVQMSLLIGTIVSGSVGATMTVIESQQEMRADLKDTKRELREISAQLGEVRSAAASRDLATASRLQDWNSWRWNVTADLHNLGKTTRTDIWTKGNP